MNYRILLLTIFLGCTQNGVGLPIPVQDADGGDDSSGGGGSGGGGSGGGSAVEGGMGGGASNGGADGAIADVLAADQVAADVSIDTMTPCDPVTSNGCPDTMKCGVGCDGIARCMARGTGQLNADCTPLDDSTCDRGFACIKLNLNTGVVGYCRNYCNADSDCPSAIPHCRQLGQSSSCDRSAFSACSPY